MKILDGFRTETRDGETAVLGIGNGMHETGAALVVDGSLRAAVNESRFSRVKRESRFPSSSINYLLENYDERIEHVAVAGTASPYLLRSLRLRVRYSSGVGQLSRQLLDWGLENVPEPDRTRRAVARRLVTETDYGSDADAVAADVEYVDHHRAHAASAYYTSGFDSATVLTVDAAGDGLSATVSLGEDGDLERIAATDNVNSIGHLWAQLPSVFGFKGERDAGKFMGLASYVDSVPSPLEREFENILDVDGLDLINRFEQSVVSLEYEEKVRRLKARFGSYHPAEVAAALQERTEAVLEEFERVAVERTGIPNVAVAGGVFANVAVNRRLSEQDVVERYFVHPNMGDGGLGAGAALAASADADPTMTPTAMESVAFGPSYDDEGIEHALGGVDLASSSVERFDDREELASRIARLLADDGVVGIFDGSLEYGPRALGQRSILVNADDPDVIRWLNASLDRTEFMPFAPVTLAEYADECYHGYDPETHPTAKFMTTTFDCTDRMRERSPGAVHADGTARPQILQKDGPQLFRRILESYHELTGVPTLINTSFNMHGEPIVRTPTQAITAFEQSELDGLVLQRYVVTP